MTIAPSQGSPRPPAGERGEREGEGGGRRGAPSPGSITPCACPPISRPAPQPSARVLPFPAPPRPALWHRRVGVRGGADPRSPARKEGGWDGRQWGRGGGGGGGSSHGLFPHPAALPCPLGPLPPRPSLPAAGPVQRRFRGRRRQHLRYAARREGRRHRRRRQTATPPADFPRSLARAPTGPRALAPSCLRRARPSGGRGRRGGGMGGA